LLYSLVESLNAFLPSVLLLFRCVLLDPPPVLFLLDA
jgi:hypothetical protein